MFAGGGAEAAAFIKPVLPSTVASAALFNIFCIVACAAIICSFIIKPVFRRNKALPILLSSPAMLIALSRVLYNAAFFCSSSSKSFSAFSTSKRFSLLLLSTLKSSKACSASVLACVPFW